jgi:hypothetical protein
MDSSNLKAINDSIIDKNLSIKRHNELLNSSVNTSNTILSVTETLIKYLNGHISKVELTNQLSSVRTPDTFKVVDAVNSLHETLKTHKNTDLSEITTVMQSILDETKLIPKELPEQKEITMTDYSDQLSNLTKAINAVEQVVKEQKLIAEAPIVNLPETVVNVEAPDLKPLQASLKDVVTAVKKIIIPEYKTDNKSVETLVKKSNELLKKLLDKPVSSGGGGGGGIVSYVGSNGIPLPVTLNTDGSIPVKDTLVSTTIQNQTNTSSEESILLRRIVKLLESNAVVDIQNRQKITLDTITTNSGGTGLNITGLSSGAGVPSPNAPTANAPIQQTGSSNWQPVWIGPVDQRFQIMDAARLTYANSIRNNLTFS